MTKRKRNSQNRSGKKEPCPKVALLIETSRGYGRDMLRGIVRYARLHGPWSFYVRPSDFDHALPKMKVWGGSGIIARVRTLQMAEAIAEAGIPAVLLGADHRVVAQRTELAGMSEVWTDSEGAARLAAAHLLERGFQHFAYIGIPESVWSQRRSEAFCSAIQDAGFATSVYEPPQSKRHLEWENEQLILAKWLKALPKPMGLMACNDDRGRDVLEACRLAGVTVPEEVAVIGVDNDELFCELSDPPLSSVGLNAEHGGYRTAHLLDQLMEHKIHTPQRLVVEPTHVVARRSTDFKTYNGREIRAALGFIDRNRAHNISVVDVADATGLSRRNLELQFRRSMGKTIREEIQRNRLEHAKRMLRDTDLPISQVAHASGYNSPSYLTQVFRKEMGTSPAKYRAQVRN